MINLVRVGLLTISWLSLVFLPKRSFRKYLPVANLAVGLILLTSLFSLPFKLWIVEKGGIKEKILTDLSIILGPFFSGTLWIFHLTYGRFGAYLLLNMVMNSLLAFPICTILQKVKLFKLVHFRPIHIFFTYIFYSIVLYGYQMFLTKPKQLLSNLNRSKIRSKVFFHKA